MGESSVSVAIVDYDVGNIGALLNMFDYLGIEALAVRDAAGILAAERLVLPGVGAFDKAMQTLHDRRLVEPLNDAVHTRRMPVLAICLGMQLLARGSEEGRLPGLGWIAADVRRIDTPNGSQLKVPHIGWSEVTPMGKQQLFLDVPPGEEPERFYFDHSYYVVCDDHADVAATIDYGGPLCCAVRRDHVIGVQFHPEKSHRFGMRLLQTWFHSSSKDVPACGSD
jgi:glutamine amidotransferase